MAGKLTRVNVNSCDWGNMLSPRFRTHTLTRLCSGMRPTGQPHRGVRVGRACRCNFLLSKTLLRKGELLAVPLTPPVTALRRHEPPHRSHHPTRGSGTDDLMAKAPTRPGVKLTRGPLKPPNGTKPKSTVARLRGEGMMPVPALP